jgi:hypothetical protein
MSRRILPACRTVSAAEALQQNLHAWQATTSDRWFVCGGCGVPGICVPCFETAKLPLPTGPVPMRCPCHAQPLARA